MSKIVRVVNYKRVIKENQERIEPILAIFNSLEKNIDLLLNLLRNEK